MTDHTRPAGDDRRRVRGTAMGIAVVNKWVRLFVVATIAAFLVLSFMLIDPNDHGSRIDNGPPKRTN